MSVIDPSPAPRSPTKTVVIAAAALVVTFIAGFLVGAVADRFLHRGRRVPPAAPHVMINRLDRHLDLSDQQRSEIQTILERRHEKIEKVWAGIQPTVRSEIDQANAEIERLLTPEQRQKFQRLRMRLGPRMHREGRGRKGPTR